jgi:hypothetical protein
VSEMPVESSQIHTRLLKCALEVEESRAYWQNRQDGSELLAQEAFENYWFGAKSFPRVKVLLTNFRARYDTLPEALWVLSQWADMAPDTRKIICHWHLQFSDPLYRDFTGSYLVQARRETKKSIVRDSVISWVGEQGPGRWTMTTRIQFASKLMSCALAAGLLDRNRDPRGLVLPRVSNEALGYLMYLMREFEFEGTQLDNPYLKSVGLDGSWLQDRLRDVPGLGFQSQAGLVDFQWKYSGLRQWAQAELITAIGGMSNLKHLMETSA